ncbi:MAG: DNA adenine methylase [Proteobacteria bacterium]|nr:DNA adenine methylase [Pseudomonadota bacterium]
MKRESSLIPARPARPVAPWIGGKRNLADRIADRIAGIPHQLYAEPFVGMGGVFLRRPFRAPGEVVNDINGEVVTLFRVLQRHYVAFLDMIRWQLTSRREFERLKATDPATLTDLERAARFIYLQRTAFGGKVAGQTFGVTYGPARFDITKLVPLLEGVHERLAGVAIECLPWDAFVDRYDRAGTLFYCDPPYWGSETDYGKGLWSREDLGRLAERLRRVKGRFLVSLNDVAAVRDAFAGCRFEAVSTTYTIGSNSNEAGAAREVIISGPRGR